MGRAAVVRHAEAVTEREAADPLSGDADARLVRRCQRGDTTAFEELVGRHQDVVLRVAARIVGEDESADVAQDTFLRASTASTDFGVMRCFGRGCSRSRETARSTLWPHAAGGRSRARISRREPTSTGSQ